MANDRLNDRQFRFCIEYNKLQNGTQAAIAAGYSAKTAGPAAHKLLKLVKIKKFLMTLQAAKIKDAGIDAAWLLNRLSCEAEADISELYVPGTQVLRPVNEWPPIWRKGLVQGITINPISGEVTVKISDRVKRLELIGKHVDVQAFKEKVEHSVDETLEALLTTGKIKVLDD